MCLISTITSFICRDLALPLCEQAALSGLSERTLRRWSSGSAADPAVLAGYLRWLTQDSGLATPVQDSADGALTSSGAQVWAMAKRLHSRAWLWCAFVIRDGRLIAALDGRSASADLAELRGLLPGLLAQSDGADVPPAPRSRAGGPHASYWTRTAEMTSAMIRVLLLSDVARRGELDGEAMSEAVRDLDRRAADLDDAARRLAEVEP
jgi:hypothetical protein